MLFSRDIDYNYPIPALRAEAAAAGLEVIKLDPCGPAGGNIRIVVEGTQEQWDAFQKED